MSVPLFGDCFVHEWSSVIESTLRTQHLALPFHIQRGGPIGGDDPEEWPWSEQFRRHVLPSDRNYRPPILGVLFHHTGGIYSSPGTLLNTLTIQSIAID